MAASESPWVLSSHAGPPHDMNRGEIAKRQQSGDDGAGDQLILYLWLGKCSLDYEHHTLAFKNIVSLSSNIGNICKEAKPVGFDPQASSIISPWN